MLNFRKHVRASLTAWGANRSRQRSKYPSVSSGNWQADDAGEHLVQGFRIAPLIEEEHQFENLHIHAFECVRAWSWSVPSQHGAVALVRNRGWRDGAGMQNDVTSFPLKRYHLAFSKSLHHEGVLPPRH